MLKRAKFKSLVAWVWMLALVVPASSAFAAGTDSSDRIWQGLGILHLGSVLDFLGWIQRLFFGGL